ncbi:hypothetical protein FYK55_01405 [Roseiconus nitratireducens]|uniref:Uncharacterized protein n=1 Tax=Roseiconus nitratireducens TaxID=2605748 RepID=A0A5M6DHU8_9BACT|nr:hypothetical protein [Roseiconus nitratireducens]KAA5547101.1 hypothetical protein FYK55_01405 [Roseiconus nitratireducens]
MNVLRLGLVSILLCWTHAATGDEPGTVRLKVQGSYEFSVDGVGVARGEGTTTIEFDRAFVDGVGREIQDSKHVVEDFIRTVVSLPATIESTNETLRMLSDPETQKALRQVEALLRLMPRTQPAVDDGQPTSK